MNQGWQCPKCEKIYAPFVAECGNCSARVVYNVTFYTLKGLSALEEIGRRFQQSADFKIAVDQI